MPLSISFNETSNGESFTLTKLEGATEEMVVWSEAELEGPFAHAWTRLSRDVETRPRRFKKLETLDKCVKGESIDWTMAGPEEQRNWK